MVYKDQGGVDYTLQCFPVCVSDLSQRDIGYILEKSKSYSAEMTEGDKSDKYGSVTVHINNFSQFNVARAKLFLLCLAKSEQLKIAPVLEKTPFVCSHREDTYNIYLSRVPRMITSRELENLFPGARRIDVPVDSNRVNHGFAIVMFHRYKEYEQYLGKSQISLGGQHDLRLHFENRNAAGKEVDDGNQPDTATEPTPGRSNESRPRSPNESRPRNPNEYHPRSFNESRPRNPNEFHPRSSNESRPRNPNEYHPRSSNESLPGTSRSHQDDSRTASAANRGGQRREMFTVNNLPMHINEAKLKEMFPRAISVVIRVSRDGQRSGIIQVTSRQDALDMVRESKQKKPAPPTVVSEVKEAPSKVTPVVKKVPAKIMSKDKTRAAIVISEDDDDTLDPGTDPKKLFITGLHKVDEDFLHKVFPDAIKCSISYIKKTGKLKNSGTVLFPSARIANREMNRIQGKAFNGRSWIIKIYMSMKKSSADKDAETTKTTAAKQDHTKSNSEKQPIQSTLSTSPQGMMPPAFPGGVPPNSMGGPQGSMNIPPGPMGMPSTSMGITPNNWGGPGPMGLPVRGMVGPPGPVRGPPDFRVGPGPIRGPSDFMGRPGPMRGPPDFMGRPGPMRGPPDFMGRPGPMRGPPDFMGPPGPMSGPPDFMGHPGPVRGPPGFMVRPGPMMGPLDQPGLLGEPPRFRPGPMDGPIPFGPGPDGMPPPFANGPRPMGPGPFDQAMQGPRGPAPLMGIGMPPVRSMSPGPVFDVPPPALPNAVPFSVQLTSAAAALTKGLSVAGNATTEKGKKKRLRTKNKKSTLAYVFKSPVAATSTKDTAAPAPVKSAPAPVRTRPSRFEPTMKVVLPNPTMKVVLPNPTMKVVIPKPVIIPDPKQTKPVTDTVANNRPKGILPEDPKQKKPVSDEKASTSKLTSEKEKSPPPKPSDRSRRSSADRDRSKRRRSRSRSRDRSSARERRRSRSRDRSRSRERRRSRSRDRSRSRERRRRRSLSRERRRRQLSSDRRNSLNASRRPVPPRKRARREDVTITISSDDERLSNDGWVSPVDMADEFFGSSSREPSPLLDIFPSEHPTYGSADNRDNDENWLTLLRNKDLGNTGRFEEEYMDHENVEDIAEEEERRHQNVLLQQSIDRSQSLMRQMEEVSSAMAQFDSLTQAMETIPNAKRKRTKVKASQKSKKRRPNVNPNTKRKQPNVKKGPKKKKRK